MARRGEYLRYDRWKDKSRYWSLEPEVNINRHRQVNNITKQSYNSMRSITCSTYKNCITEFVDFPLDLSMYCV